MIVQGKNKETGKFEAKVYDANNCLFATVEGNNAKEVELKAFEVQREALMPIMGGMTIPAEIDALSDDELLAELGL
jgi:hypothetical protein